MGVQLIAYLEGYMQLLRFDAVLHTLSKDQVLSLNGALSVLE